MSSSGFTSAGKAKYAAWGVLFVVNIIVLALSARVNQFQQYFYVADLFPLALSAITLGLMVILTVIDLGVHNSFTARPAFDLTFLSVFSILWMIFNAFSTNRWSGIPMACSSIPEEYADERTWCSDVQGLKAMVWVEWVGFFLTAVLTLRYVVAQNSAGRRHVWRTPLSRYSASAGGFATNENIGGHMAFNGASATSTFEQQYSGSQAQPQEDFYGQTGGAEAGYTANNNFHYRQPSMGGQYRGQTGYGATSHSHEQHAGYSPNQYAQGATSHEQDQYSPEQYNQYSQQSSQYQSNQYTQSNAY